MALETRLKDEGWYLTPEWIAECSKSGANENIKSITSKALDSDLQEIGLKFLPDDINRGKILSIPGNCILQIMQITNVAVPKFSDKESSARLLKIQLTDGHIKCFGVEIATINAVSMKTPPGTKVKLTAKVITVQNGFLLLDNTMVDVLGGQVESLIEKWNLKHSLKRIDRGATGREGGPPPWVSFGQPIVGLDLKDSKISVKTLESKKEMKEGDTHFDQQRKATIAEAAAKVKEGGKKVFSGSGKQIFDRDIAQIMELGYSIDDANNALRASNGNAEQAVKYLQRGKPDFNSRRTNQQPPRKPRYGRGSRNDDDDGGAVQSQPTKSTLFDFLQSKMSSLDMKTTSAPVASVTASQDFGTGIQSAVVASSVSSSQRLEDNRPGSKGPYRDGPGRRESNPKWNRKPDRFSENRRDNRHPQQRPPQRSESWVTDTSNSNIWPKPGQQVETQTQQQQPIPPQLPKDRAPSATFPPQVPQVPQVQPGNQFQGSRGAPQQPPVHRPQENFQFRNHTSNGPKRQGQESHNHQTLVQKQNEMTVPNSTINKKVQLSNARIPMSDPMTWKSGDLCLAKYWEDSKFYPAVVHEVAANGATCVILFTDYGNYEEVVVQDIIPIQQDKMNTFRHGDPDRTPSRPTLEFRRSNNRAPQGPPNNAAANRYNPNQFRKPPQPMYVPPAQRQ